MESRNRNQKAEVAVHAGVCSANKIHAASFSQDRQAQSLVKMAMLHLKLSTRSWVCIAPGRQKKTKFVNEQVALNMAVLLFELTDARSKLCTLHARLSNLTRILNIKNK